MNATIIFRSKKKSGKIKLRFRLTEGRGFFLYHKSNIEAEISDIGKIEPDGSLKKQVKILPPKELLQAIESEIKMMEEVFESADPKPSTSEEFELLIDKRLHPENYKEEIKYPDAPKDLLTRFGKYIHDGLFSETRKRAYWVTYRILERFLIIEDEKEIQIDEVTPDFLMNFRDFIINEWKFVTKKKWAYLYADVTKQNIPDAPRVQNTVATKLKHFQAFFRMLEDTDEIVKSPFRKMGRENRLSALRESYADPISMTADEVRKIISTDVPDSLRPTKDAFLIQCALGCRISDFKEMGMDSVAVSKEGVPYIHYLPKKTMNTNIKLEEVKTPIMRFAFDIIRRTNFDLPILKYVSGKSGFNVKIKELLKCCGIDREISIFNEDKKVMEYLPLYEVGCTKLCRKTFVDITTKVQVNRYAAGLHKAGSDAVNHYSKLQLTDLNILMCEAFGEKPFKVNKNLDIVE